MLSFRSTVVSLSTLVTLAVAGGSIDNGAEANAVIASLVLGVQARPTAAAEADSVLIPYVHCV